MNNLKRTTPAEYARQMVKEYGYLMPETLETTQLEIWLAVTVSGLAKLDRTTQWSILRRQAGRYYRNNLKPRGLNPAHTPGQRARLMQHLIFVLGEYVERFDYGQPGGTEETTESPKAASGASNRLRSVAITCQTDGLTFASYGAAARHYKCHAHQIRASIREGKPYKGRTFTPNITQ